MKLKKALGTATLLGSLLASTFLTGCSTNRVVIHPLSQTDIVLLSEGEQFTAPKSGAFLSDFYIEEVMQARVKDVR